MIDTGASVSRSVDCSSFWQSVPATQDVLQQEERDRNRSSLETDAPFQNDKSLQNNSGSLALLETPATLTSRSTHQTITANESLDLFTSRDYYCESLTTNYRHCPQQNTTRPQTTPAPPSLTPTPPSLTPTFHRTLNKRQILSGIPHPQATSHTLFGIPGATSTPFIAESSRRRISERSKAGAKQDFETSFSLQRLRSTANGSSSSPDIL